MLDGSQLKELFITDLNVLYTV